jgi:hypothetical protein
VVGVGMAWMKSDLCIIVQFKQPYFKVTHASVENHA